MLGLGRRTGGNGHIRSSDLPPRQQAEKRRVLLEWILHCGSTLLYPTLLELHMLTGKLTDNLWWGFFMQNKVTPARGQWCTAPCTCVWPCTLGVQGYSVYVGGRRVAEQTETQNLRWDNAHKGQHGGFWLDGRKEFLEEKHSLGAGYWGGCGNCALGGFMAQQRKPSSSWCGESPMCAGGDCWASGSSLQTSFWTGSKCKLYLYIKQLYPI